MNPAILNIIAVAFTIVGAVLFALVAWLNVRYPGLKPHHVVNVKQVSERTTGFQWAHMERMDTGRGIIPRKATADGAIWTGFTLGIHRQTGETASILMTLYGAEQGVGHYTLFIKTDPYKAERGAGGHFNLDRLEGEKRSTEDRWIIEAAAYEASRSMQEYRPLSFRYDENTDTVSEIYDPVSGRALFFRPNHEDRTRFVFGPFPSADENEPYNHQPGLHIAELEPDTPGDPLPRLVVSVRDVYGQPLDHASVELASASGYRYEQTLPDDSGSIHISMPIDLKEINVVVSRGGYHAQSANVPLGQNTQRVDAILEPMHKRVGNAIVETGPSPQ